MFRMLVAAARAALRMLATIVVFVWDAAAGILRAIRREPPPLPEPGADLEMPGVEEAANPYAPSAESLARARRLMATSAVEILIAYARASASAREGILTRSCLDAETVAMIRALDEPTLARIARGGREEARRALAGSREPDVRRARDRLRRKYGSSESPAPALGL